MFRSSENGSSMKNEDADDTDDKLTYTIKNETLDTKKKKVETIKKGQGFFKNKKEALYYVIDIAFNAVVIFGLVILIRTFLISPFQVSGQSMCNTLNFVDGVCLTQQSIGEYIIINKLSYYFSEIKRGDVVVFVPPIKKDEYYVKRIIGLPGDKIQIKNGYVWTKMKNTLQWRKLDEIYLNEQNQGRTFVSSDLDDYVFEVPTDHYFMLGDYRTGSSDSRYWKDFESGERVPFVAKKDIDGKVWLVLWPFDNIRTIQETIYPELDIRE